MCEMCEALGVPDESVVELGRDSLRTLLDVIHEAVCNTLDVVGGRRVVLAGVPAAL